MLEPENDQQKKFFDLLLDGMIKNENGKTVYQSVGALAKEAGYDRAYAYQLYKKYKEYFFDLLSSKLALHAPQAIQVFIDGMADDGKNPGAKEQRESAREVLDRVGIVKKEKVEVSFEGTRGLFILPAKDIEEEIVDENDRSD